MWHPCRKAHVNVGCVAVTGSQLAGQERLFASRKSERMAHGIAVIDQQRFEFPAWTDKLRPLIAVGALGGLVYVTLIVWFGGSAKTLNVGFAPNQPVPYSHALHVGKLGMDCRYCHTTVENAAMAAVPPTQTCMNCHSVLRTQVASLEPVRDAYATGEPVHWKKVHDLPDYVYFNHSAHVARGVSCVSCHGRVDQMEVVTQVEPLSMSWCLDCHRNPYPNLRPPELVTDLAWEPSEDPEALGRRLAEERHINPSTDCSTCHR